MNQSLLDEYRYVQSIAKRTMAVLQKDIHVGMTEEQIADLAVAEMKELGVEKFWYHGVGAFVLAGKRTTLSISGRDYVPSKDPIQLDDLVTIDLSPQIGEVWGDYARSFAMLPDGAFSYSRDPIFCGLKFEEELHAEFLQRVTGDMTFHDVFFLMNDYIGEREYQNLDFNSNLGHTIVTQLDERVYLKRDSALKVKDAGLFTFEPHISLKSPVGERNFGFKREDIYYFSDGRLHQL